MFSRKRCCLSRACIFVFSALLIIGFSLLDGATASAKSVLTATAAENSTKAELFAARSQPTLLTDFVETSSFAAPSTIPYLEMEKLVAADGESQDEFGRRIAIEGDIAVISAHGVRTGPINHDRGAVYVYARKGLKWVIEQRLIASDGENFEAFGLGGVTVEGNTIVVGTYLDNIGTNSRQGSVYIFEKMNSVWTEKQKLIASDGGPDDWFGYSISTSENALIIGAPNDDIGAVINQGSAYIFIKENNVWTQKLN